MNVQILIAKDRMADSPEVEGRTMRDNLQVEFHRR
jgi:hypothetical protein